MDFATLKSNQVSINDFIVHHMTIVDRAAYRFCKRHEIEHDVEEYEAQGYLILVECTHTAITHMVDDNFEAYMYHRVKSGLRQHFVRSRAVSQSQSNLWTSRSRGDMRPQMNKHDTDSLTTNDPEPYMDLDRLSDAERIILDFKIQGYTVDDISRLLGKTTKAVRRILRQVRNVLFPLGRTTAS